MLGTRQLLQPLQPEKRVFTRCAAHLGAGLEAAANGGALGAAEQIARQVGREVCARLARPLAVGHLRSGGGNGRGDATGTTAGAAVHRYYFDSCWRLLDKRQSLFWLESRRALWRSERGYAAV